MAERAELEITYLLNSGFLLRQGRQALLFDCFEDPSGTLQRSLPELEELTVFVSHAHFDHYSEKMLARCQAKADYIFLSSDIKPLQPRLEAGKIIWLEPYSQWEGTGRLSKVQSFSSTDEGTSFLVDWAGYRIFHAGDFNWWHWEGDTELNNKFARNGFVKQMKKLAGLECDIAFFPIDGRQGKAQGWGAREFCAQTTERLLVGMHNVGYPRWTPPPDFFATGQAVPVWSPVESGEVYRLPSKK